ncbi:MAG: hypothetical protein AAF581_04595 [Planctomycetota bacterium]
MVSRTLLMVAVLAVLPGFGQPPAPPAAADVDAWIRALAAHDWSERERATGQLLESGAAAIAPLRAALATGDPEVQERLRWLLSVLDPEMHRVRLLRLSAVSGTEPEGERRLVEWIDLETSEDQLARGMSENTEGEGRQLFAATVPGTTPTRLWLRFGDAERMSREVVAGEVALLQEEERVEYDTYEGRLQRRRFPALWVVWLDPKGTNDTDTAAEKAPATSPGSAIEQELRAALATQLRSEDESSVRTALRVAAFLRAREVVEAAPSKPAWRAPLLLARLECGDDSAQSDLEQWLIASSADLDEDLADDRDESTDAEALAGDADLPVPMPTAIDPLQGRIAIELTRRGSAVGRDHLLQHLIHLVAWRQYQGLTALSAILNTPADSEGRRPHVAEVLAALCDKGLVDDLPWAHIEAELVLQRIEDGDRAAFREKLVEMLDRGLATDTNMSSNKTRALIRALLRYQAAGDVPIERWFTPLLLPLLGSRYTEEGICIARDAFLAGKLTAEQWQQVLDKLAAIYTEENTGSQHRIETVLKQLVHCRQLTPEQVLALWVVRLASYESSGYIRQQVDRDLSERYGALESKMPAGKNAPPEEWLQRRDEWRKKLEELGDAIVSPPDEKQRRFHLVEVDFRADLENRDVRPLRFESFVLLEGDSYPATGPDGEDRTRRVEPMHRNARAAQQRYSIRTSQYAELDKPEVFTNRQRAAFREHIVQENNWGPQNIARRRQTTYRTLVLLTEATDSEAAPFQDWQEFSAAIADRAMHGPRPGAYRKIVGELLIEEARQPLRELYLEEPHPGLARVLMKLGDTVGMDTLRKSINPTKNPRNAVHTLKEMVVAGDDWAVKKTLEWLRTPPQPVAGQRYTLLDGLDQALTSTSDPLVIDEDELYATLIGCLDQRNLLGKAVPILRRRTGLNFGYYDTFQIRDRKRQTEAQSKVIEKWQGWWRERSAAGQ